MTLAITLASLSLGFLINRWGYSSGYNSGYNQGKLDGSNEALCKKVKKCDKPHLEHIIVIIYGVEMDGLIEKKEQKIKVRADNKDYHIMKSWFSNACNSTMSSGYKKNIVFEMDDYSGVLIGAFCSSTTPFSSIIRYDAMKNRI